MPLVSGTKLGLYEILAPLGAGGMGEVYRARDTRLKRDVALKVLPDAFARDPGRMARFQREAEVLASLNHPNIAAIYGVEERALVMELVEGEAPKGPMPFDEAWKIAAQMADALEYAHDRGVVHRDLKPANIKVTHEGVVKLLDFGLAKAFGDPAETGSGDPANSPTIALEATVAGTLLGTAAYMAPEQAKGKRVDRRADIWAWGVVLYELLTGERLFKGEDASDTLAQVLTKQPDLQRVPANARRLLWECLQKDPKLRLRDIGDAKRLLGEAPAPVKTRVRTLPWIVTACIATIAALGLGFVLFRQKAAPPPEPVRFTISAPEKTTLAPGLSVSPDGRRVVFAAVGDGGPRLWIRALDSLESRLLRGTEGVNAIPFWSWDSRYVVFSADGRLKKVDITGGPPQALCELQGAANSGFWTRDGRIVFGTNRGMMEVSAAGGSPHLLTKIEPIRGETWHTSPSLLPDGKHFVYERYPGSAETAGVYLASLDAKPEEQGVKQLLSDPSNALYAPSLAPGAPLDEGYLVFLRDRVLMAQPFNNSTLQPEGEAIPLAEQLAPGPSPFSVSPSGVLVYVNGPVGERSFTWYDRQGHSSATSWPPANYNEVNISRDGGRAAVVVQSGGGISDIWWFEFARGARTRLTNGPGTNIHPVWSPSGEQIVYTAAAEGYKMRLKSSSGAGEEVLLHECSRAVCYAVDWSRDGRFLLYEENNQKAKSDFWYLAVDGDRKAVSYLQTGFNQTEGQFSPDGRYVAYVSDQSGASNVYVSSFPDPRFRAPISSGGGTQPRWGKDGKELLYWSSDGKLMSVDVTLSPAFKAGVARQVLQAPIYRGGGNNATREYWDVAPDGQRFLINTSASEAGAPLTVVLNWQAGLKK